jgi:hypothetical protein
MVNAATITLTVLLVVVVIYAVRQRRNFGLAIYYSANLMSQNNKLKKIVSYHGCAPDHLVAEETIHECEECGTRWKSRAPQIEWIDDRLSNKTSQQWDVV